MPEHASSTSAKSALPRALHILNEGARRLLALGRTDLAEAVVARAFAEGEDNADTHSVAVAVVDAQGDWPGALAHLRRAHALMPNAPPKADVLFSAFPEPPAHVIVMPNIRCIDTYRALFTFSTLEHG